MRLTDRFVGCMICILLILTIAVSCSTIPKLKVTYRLPPESGELEGKKIHLTFKDTREVKDLLGESAKKEFKYFSGNISLSIAKDNAKGSLIGIFDIRSLFIETFNRKLERMGLTVVSGGGNGQTELVIVLTEFVLDLVNRRWVARMSYEARIVKSGNILARQTINGEAERLKLVGRSQADIVMDDIFTDVINRLDVEKLFKNASQHDL
ncbi:hypothetical protein ACFLZG_00500 [Thermodesulfobacteriota bacterium]